MRKEEGWERGRTKKINKEKNVIRYIILRVGSGCYMVLNYFGVNGLLILLVLGIFCRISSYIGLLMLKVLYEVIYIRWGKYVVIIVK